MKYCRTHDTYTEKRQTAGSNGTRCSIIYDNAIMYAHTKNKLTSSPNMLRMLIKEIVCNYNNIITFTTTHMLHSYN